MGSVASNSSSGSPGTAYRSRVYFDPDSDKGSGPTHRINDQELKTKMMALIKDEVIEDIAIYSHPLNKSQITSTTLYHAFVLVGTKQWWWSFEKNSEGVTVQRSKKIAYVRIYYQRDLRIKNVEKVIEDSGRKTMKDLVHFLYQKDLVGSKYSVTTSNCKHFSKALFDEFASVKYWKPLDFSAW